jgi:hypothetical protein
MRRLILQIAKAPRHRGQTLALMVLGLPVLIGAMGLAADVGDLYFNYVKVQAAADASVLSGAKYLPDQPGAAISTATTYATSFNGIAATEIISTTTAYDATLCPAPGSPPPAPFPGCKLTMTVQRTVPYYFGRLVGVNSGTVSVAATATVGVPAVSVNYGVIPIGVQVGGPYSDGSAAALLFVPNPRSPVAIGTWSSLALGGVSFLANMPGGSTSKVSMNGLVAPDKSLTSSGPASAAILKQIDAGQAVDPSGNYAAHTANDMRAVTVALVDWNSCCFIKGFAQLWLDNVLNGDISGHWIANGVDGSPDTTGTAPHDGTLAISLTN